MSKLLKACIYGLFLLVALSPLASTAISMTFMPDIVALHWGFDGQVDHFGPKEELFIAAGILTFCLLLCWGCLVFTENIIKMQPWKNQSASSIRFSKILLAAVIFILAVVNAWFLSQSYFGGISHAGIH